MKFKYKIFVLFIFISVLQYSQNIDFPRISPHASVSQTIGFTSMTIDYHRPGVKGRVIWGSLVPYGEIWRGGANKNTTFEISGDVKINGEDLPAGKYGFHLLPGEDEWIIIFNKVNNAWGSFFYDESKNALRVKVKPVSTAFCEWLQYGFDDLKQNSCVAYLRWEKLKIPFKIEIDFHENVLNHFRNELVSIPGFSWQGYYQAANYCLQNEINYDEAMVWIDKSIEINPTLPNLYVKSELLRLKGKNEEADRLIKNGIEIADEEQLNTYGYALLAKNELDSAIEIFKLNAERNPKSWNVYDSLGDAMAKKGDLKEAKRYFKIAYEKAPENQKDRIQKIINSLH